MAGRVRGAWSHSVEITEDVPLSVQQLPVGGSCSPLRVMLESILPTYS